MRNFLIFVNADKDENLELSSNITNYIKQKGGQSTIVNDCYDRRLFEEKLLASSEAVIVLGGDGTMLRAAACIGTSNTPLIGINLGTMGFLTEVETQQVYKVIDRLFIDDFSIEERVMIEGTVKNKTYRSLNDVVITRAGFSRIIGLSIYVNDQLLDTYEADGVIVATPTGSTGYNLSAGGPIVSPKSRVIVVTPISPHSLTTKSVVFDFNDKIKIEIVKQRKTQDTEAIVSFDGDNNTELSAGDVINVEASAQTVKLIRMYDVNFYSVLRDKIGGRMS